MVPPRTLAPMKPRVLPSGAVLDRASNSVQLAKTWLKRQAFGVDFDERIARVTSELDVGHPFGLSVEAFAMRARLGALLHRVYFRSECYGLEHFPSGPVIVVANHSGQLPIDGAVIAAALLLELNPGRALRVALDARFNRVPLVLAALGRLGHVPLDRGALRALLDRGQSVLVFPEGANGLMKPYRSRYQLQPFATDFVDVAAMTGAPVVPLAVVGAEEQYVNLANLEPLARLLHLPALPVIPQLLVPGAQLPLPARYRLHFGEPLHFPLGHVGAEETSHRAWLVRQSIQHLLGFGLRQRRRVFW